MSLYIDHASYTVIDYDYDWMHNVSYSFFWVCQRHHTTIQNHWSTKKTSDRSLDHRERKPNKSAPKESIWIQRIHRPQISHHDSPCHATIWCEEYGSDVGKRRTSATHPKAQKINKATVSMGFATTRHWIKPQPHCTGRSRSGRLQIKRPLLKSACRCWECRIGGVAEQPCDYVTSMSSQFLLSLIHIWRTNWIEESSIAISYANRVFFSPTGWAVWAWNLLPAEVPRFGFAPIPRRC